MSSRNQFSILEEIGKQSVDGLIVYSLVEKRTIYINKIADALLGSKGTFTVLSLDFILSRIVTEDHDLVRQKYIELQQSRVSTEFEFSLIDDTILNATVSVKIHVVFDQSTIVAFIRELKKEKTTNVHLSESGVVKNFTPDKLTHHLSGALKLMEHLALEAEKSFNNRDNENVKTYLSLVRNNCNHCLAVVDELLTIQQEQSEHGSIKAKRIDIVERIFHIFSELQQSYKTRTFTFNSTLPSIHITTDELKLLQVVGNYTSNAIKFSEASQAIAISIMDKHDEVVVSITDNGIGIADELKQSIFESSIVGRPGLKGEKSHGLGLSISKYLIEEMNGKVWFESMDNVGSTFYFSLPKK